MNMLNTIFVGEHDRCLHVVMNLLIILHESHFKENQFNSITGKKMYQQQHQEIEQQVVVKRVSVYPNSPSS
jgi:hypothetical protein